MPVLILIYNFISAYKSGRSEFDMLVPLIGLLMISLQKILHR